jgi:hypothetical protein
MCASPALRPAPSTCDALRAGFLALLPRIETHARIAFRDVACPGRRADCVAEVVALAWRWYVELAGRGKDAAEFVAQLARYAAQAVRCGRRVCGQERAGDVLSPTAQRRHGFAVGSLPGHSTLGGNAWDEALAENTRSEVPAQAAFRIDFPRWRRTLSARDRCIVDELMTGERPQRVARRHGLTSGRVSQLRRRFHREWLRFHGEPCEPASAHPGAA